MCCLANDGLLTGSQVTLKYPLKDCPEGEQAEVVAIEQAYYFQVPRTEVFMAESPSRGGLTRIRKDAMNSWQCRFSE